ncbi:hypothetical protein DOTSEDRAFT_72865 [Dothistroma septosporum NZE10]|uniref:Protein kinase domain-containing protein n=1 Tax=Dothistroma septosporum (strain NZE10 / CBS 128990) TaxID=675120 RepID=M2WNQ2_DOTSN|nr:hypothetical protein DOTSEDRAFT_72865 [Dothistroma septosporum NZE10]
MNLSPNSGNYTDMSFSPQQCICHQRGVCGVCVAVRNNQAAGQGIGMYPASPVPTAADMPYFDMINWNAAVGTDQSYIGNQTLDGYLPNYGNPIAQPGAQESGYVSQPLQSQDYTQSDCLPSPFVNHLQLPVVPRRLETVDEQTIEIPRSSDALPFSQNNNPVDMGAGLHGTAVKRRDVAKSIGKRPMRDVGTADDTADQPTHKSRKLYDASEHLQFNREQTELLELKLQHWQKISHLPVDKELKSIAAACDLSPLKVALWFGAKLRLHEGPTGLVPQQLNALQPSSTMDVSPMIWKYINDAATKDCTPGKSIGKYHCTWGCTYSTDSRFDWERHEESKQPQNFWACIICRGLNNGASFITHRRDKLFPHIHSMHSKEENNKVEVRDKSKVAYEAPYIRDCSYTMPSTGRPCGHIFESWKERNDHWIAHFNDDADGLDDQLHLPGNKDVGDGGSTGNSKSTASNGSSTSGSSAPPSSQQSSVSRQSRSQHSSAGRRRAHQALSCEVVVKTEPIESESSRSSDSLVNELRLTFIDVHEGGLVTPDLIPQFLALDCSIEPMQRLSHETCLRLNASTNVTLPARDGVVTVLKAAIEIARDMGFDYLWSDLVSTSTVPQANRDEIYRKAMLITSMGFRKNDPQPIWHFTSDFDHLEKIQTWSRNRDWFKHEKPLGQGAYGFVDKVRLASFNSPVEETYARKIVLRDRTNKSQRARYLKEIKIMQSLAHRNIARFEAAYCDRTAFNILMSPVADGDLRQFLNDPEEFKTKQPHLPQWFLSLANALAYMHSKNFRHKDIKPANILISDNDVLLTDFGTSLHLSKSTSTTTGSGAFLTPKYSAPEVAAQEDRGLPADIFSLGCVFVEMIAIVTMSSLDMFHSVIGLADEFKENGSNYNQCIPQLQIWLRSLAETPLQADLAKAVRITERMVDSEPKERPSAADVAEALCGSLGMFHGDLRHEYFTINRILSLELSGSDLQELALRGKVNVDECLKSEETEEGGSAVRQSKLDLFKQHLHQALQDQQNHESSTTTSTGTGTAMQALQRSLASYEAGPQGRPWAPRRESAKAYQKRVASEYAMSLYCPMLGDEDMDSANTIRGMRTIEDLGDEEMT